MENGEYVQGSFWFYAPDKGTPIAFSIVFLISEAWHLWQCSKYGSWRLTGFLACSATAFIIAFILRGLGAYNYDNQGLYTSSTVFFNVAPPFYEYSNYIILSRLLYYVPYHAPIHPGRIIGTYHTFTIFLLTLTASAVAQAANGSNTSYGITVGQALLKTSLILQLGSMLFLILVAARWQWNCSRDGKLDAAKRGTSRNIKKVLHTLYFSCALIAVRIVYGIVESFAYGSHAPPGPGTVYEPDSVSPVIRFEWFFWVFDASLMLCNTILLNCRHPAQDLPRSYTTYLAEDGTETEGIEYRDCRSGWLRLIDPFDIGRVLRVDRDRWWESSN